MDEQQSLSLKLWKETLVDTICRYKKVPDKFLGGEIPWQRWHDELYRRKKYEDEQGLSMDNVEHVSVWNREITEEEEQVLKNHHYLTGFGTSTGSHWAVPVGWPGVGTCLKDKHLPLQEYGISYPYSWNEFLNLENKMKVKRITEDGIPPFRGSSEAAGLDFMSAHTVKLASGTIERVGTGIAIEIPKGNVGILAIRSGLAEKGLSLANGVGVIDSDYRGPIGALVRYDGKDAFYTLRRGDRFLQLIVMPIKQMGVEVVDELSETQRGGGGFGSTGK